MSQVATPDSARIIVDPYEIGWYIDSADEETYGPVSRKTLRRFLDEQTITPNTLVRHCTQPEARPVADQPAILESHGLAVKGSALGDPMEEAWKGPALGDRMAEAWPRKTRDRQALAEDSVPCAWHKKPAALVCVRCHAPYCVRCTAKPRSKQFFLCRKCQTGIYNRRIYAYFVDVAVLVSFPMIAASIAISALVKDPTQAAIVIYIIYFACLGLVFLRDSLFRGASPGKRLVGLRVVQSRDGTTPLTHGQGIVRWLSQFIPFFNLVDLSVPYRDPLLRRYGDRWAGTRVIDSERKLAKARGKLAKRLLRKGVQPPPAVGMTMEGLARIV